jgi:hypothetical protein
MFNCSMFRPSVFLLCVFTGGGLRGECGGGLVARGVGGGGVGGVGVGMGGVV